MGSVVTKLREAGLITPPGWLPDNVMYETIMGSEAYGVSSGGSDRDIYGFCVPPKDVLFPHLAGEIFGFGNQTKRFEQYQQVHVEHGDMSHDVTIYSITKYFQLCMENNPNMVDSLFTPRRCVLHTTAVGEMVRDNRRMFLHRGCWHKFKGYAYQQLNKMSGHERHGKRKELHEKFGFDVKFAYHVVRLLYEAEMVLTEMDLDLERHREHLKAIRRGEVTEEEIRRWAAEKEKFLEKAYEESKLPWGPDESAIKALLIRCLEHHYGSLSDAVAPHDVYRAAFRQIEQIVAETRKSLGK